MKQPGEMEGPPTGPSAVAVEVYDRVLERFGEPDLRIDSGTGAESSTIVSVFAWYPTTEVPLTTFATIGMCDVPIHGANHRVELHFARAGDLADNEIEAVGQFLIHLAGWTARRSVLLDWWHLLPGIDTIPTYPGCHAMLMHPAFSHGGWDRVEVEIEDPGSEERPTEVRMLNIVPLTDTEAEEIRTEGLRPTMERLYALESGMFAPRPTKPSS
ncbi:MAG: suppressor of fused domain protein [Acidobacteriota bacterium]|nr:suppressor of fused domain protein [Acidobacteriota bacterium]MDH3785239.1 suppressor of fused domain protein [Acidobacteriota bacterium]